MGADVEDLAAWLTQIWDEQEAEVQKWQATLLADIPIPAALLGGIVVPRTALARIAADREILDIHSPDPRDASVCTTCGEPLEYCWPWPCDTVKALASPYADRPGYREEWKP